MFFNSQCYSEDGLKHYLDFSQIEKHQNKIPADKYFEQEFFIDNFGVLQVCVKGYVMNTDLEYMDSETVLQVCEKSILGIAEDRIYLATDKLLIMKGHYLLANDQQQWVRLREVFKDNIGFYLSKEDMKCPNGHVGFKKLRGVWYCLNDDCKYCYYKQ